MSMATVSVTSKGQVTIPKQVRRALGITPGSKVAFDLDQGGARLRLVKRQIPSRVEEGPAILDYTGPRIPIARMHGGFAVKKAAKRARR
jgi:AbrB family looped-hinge helix DNA binding protein